MKTMLLLGSLSTDLGEAVAIDEMSKFVTEAIDRSEEVQLRWCHLDELAFVVNNQNAQIYDMHNKVLLTAYDLVFFRGKLRSAVNHVALASYFLHKQGVPSVNTVYKKWRAVGKVAQMFQMRDAGLPIIDTVSSSAKYLPELVAKHLHYPVVVKDVHGGHGHHNFLIDNEAALQKVLFDHPDLRFMAQTFVPNDGDYRLLFVGKETRIILRKGSGTSHLNNTSQGATASLAPIESVPEEIVIMARHFAQECNYEFAGVDVMQDSKTGKYYFLEINSQPQIATGAFVSEKSTIVGNFFREQLGIE